MTWTGTKHRGMAIEVWQSAFYTEKQSLGGPGHLPLTSQSSPTLNLHVEVCWSPTVGRAKQQRRWPDSASSPHTYTLRSHFWWRLAVEDSTGISRKWNPITQCSPAGLVPWEPSNWTTREGSPPHPGNIGHFPPPHDLKSQRSARQIKYCDSAPPDGKQ